MKRIWLVALVTLVILGGLGVWLGRPVYKRIREHHFLSRATALMKKGDYANAHLSLRQTLAANPGNVEACRLMADLAEMSRSPYALVWRKRVAELAPSIDNRIILASCALRFEQAPFPLAARTLEELREVANQRAAFHVVAAQLSILRNSPIEAQTHFQEAIRLDPTNQLHQLNLAVVRLHSTNQAIVAEARAALERLRPHPQLGILALRSLVADSVAKKDLETAEHLSRQLLADPKSAFPDRVAHLAILHDARNGDFKSYLQTLQQEASTNSLHIYEVSARMIAYGLADDALSWLKSLPTATRSQQPVPLAVANCYEAKADWPGLEKFLREDQWSDNEFTRLALLSRSLRMQGESKVAHANWLLAVEATEHRLELVTLLARLASAWQWQSETKELFWLILKKYPRERWVLPELHKLYARSRSSQDLLEFYTGVWKLDPSDLPAKNNVASLSLLLNSDTEKAHALAREVYQQNPTNSVFVSTYAYSLHLQGKTQEGLKLFQRIKDQEMQKSSIALYYGLLLAAAGDTPQAQKYLAQAEQSSLLPEEKTLLTLVKK